MKRITVLLLFLATAAAAMAQKGGNIKGFIYDKATGEAVPYSNVFFKGTTIGVSSDLNGYFSITRIPPGKYTLLVTNLEFDTIRENIEIKDGDNLSRKFYATKGGIALQEVEVSTNSFEKNESTTVGTTKIDPVVVNKLPSIGEPDIAQYLQVLPGVVFTGDQGGQLYIRGGLPVQNKVLLDGLTIYNPFHSIGLFSVFDNDIMKNADVYSAGFGAEYGGRTSSVMDITTRDGNKKRVAGKVSLSTFGVKALLEGPFKKLKEDGDWSSSYLLSVKHSYLPQTSKIFYPYAREGGLPFEYTDLYGKVSLNSVSGSKINLFGFNFNDKVNYDSFRAYQWQNNGLGANFVLVPANTNILFEGVCAYSNYKINFTNPSLPTDSRSSSIGGVTMTFNILKFIRKNEFRIGFEGNTMNTVFLVHNPYYATIEMKRSTIDIAGFAKYKLIAQRGRLVFEPSLRLQYYASLGVFSPEPRGALKYNITKKIRFKAAGGLYSQTLMAANSDRDVVNLFYGFINAPNDDEINSNYVDKNGNVKNTNSSVQKANHVVTGVEFDFLKFFELNVEVYQKNFNQIININRDKIYEDNTTNASRPDEEKKTFVIEQGRARGFDVVLKYDRKRFYFWAVYSLTYNQRWVGNSITHSVTEYPPTFDRRHNVNLVASYSFGKKKNWEANVRYNFGTGFPFTQTQGFFNQLNPSGSVQFDPTTANGQLNYIPAALNGGRLPDYARLDMSVKYRYRWDEKRTLEIAAGATNVTNRQNIFQIDRFTFHRENQLPVMPNLNVSLSF